MKGTTTHHERLLGVHAQQLAGARHGEGIRLGRAVLHADARVEEGVDVVRLEEGVAVLARPARHHGEALRAAPPDLLNQRLWWSFVV